MVCTRRDWQHRLPTVGGWLTWPSEPARSIYLAEVLSTVFGPVKVHLNSLLDILMAILPFSVAQCLACPNSCHTRTVEETREDAGQSTQLSAASVYFGIRTRASPTGIYPGASVEKCARPTSVYQVSRSRITSSHYPSMDAPCVTSDPKLEMTQHFAIVLHDTAQTTWRGIVAPCKLTQHRTRARLAE